MASVNIEDVVRNIIDDVAVDLTQAFDRNFERKAFFDRAWPSAKLINNKGSLMMRNGKLRRSINVRKGDTGIKWTSNKDYASIHNEGGEVKVTAQMKKFFWAMYYKSHGAANIFSVKTKKKVNTKRTRRLSVEAAQWKALALKKVGSVIEVKQRQFIGWHPEVNRRIEAIHKMHAQDLNQIITNKLKP